MGKLLGSSTKSTDEVNNKEQPNTGTNNEAQPPHSSEHTPKASNANLNQHDLSSSLVTSVNIAAETARLVLANEEIVKSAITSKCSSFASLPAAEEEEGEERNYKLDWVTSKDDGGDKTVTFSSPPPQSKVDDSRVEQSSSTTNTDKDQKDDESKGVSMASPPPLAFQNLPMSRYMPVSNSEHSDRGGIVVGGNKTFEVTNHFDAAAAISAALASSHLAQASQSVGELQTAKGKMGKMNGDDFSMDDGGGAKDLVLTPSTMHPSQLRTLPSPEEAEKEMRARMNSYESFNDTKARLVKLSDDNKAESADQVAAPGRDENEPVGTNTRRESGHTEGGDSSISICSSNVSSNYENESNTSSYGLSDISPITMSFGPSSEDGKHGQSGGILGSLANPPAAVALQGDASYDPSEDDEEATAQEGRNGGITSSPIRSKMSDPGPKMSMQLAPSRQYNGGDYNNSFDSSSRTSSEDAQPKVVKQLTPATTIHISQHYLSLFESFDRNWMQSVEGNPNKERVLELGKMFLSSFVVVLGMCGENHGRAKKNNAKEQSNSIASGTDTGLTRHDWWEDSNILGYDLGIVGTGSDDHKGVLAGGSSGEQWKFSSGVPITVVRTLWKSCFFDDDDVEVENVLDLIQDHLVSTLCYLSATECSEAMSLCLTLPLYKNYAWYLLSQLSLKLSVEETVASWHAKFAGVLREVLLSKHKGTGESEVTLRRYAAIALPRHTAFGIKGIGQDGEFRFEENSETRRKVRINVIQKLLCNALFISARAEVLGSGRTRKKDLDKSLDNEMDKNLVRAITDARDEDHNLLEATIVSIKDIEWMSTSCELMDCQNAVNEGQGNNCLDALAMWRLKLLVLCSEQKNTSVDGKAAADLQQTSLLSNSGILKGSCLHVAKSLLSKDDAWSANNPAEGNAQGKKVSRSRRSRQKKINPTSLGLVINVSMCHLRTQISIGRALLSLAKFAQSMLGKYDSGPVGSFLQEQISLNLRDAIEVLSGVSKTLHLIQSDLFADLEEDDLDDTVTSVGPSLCLQKFVLTRAEAKPLLTLTGIFLAESWYFLGRMAASPSTARTHKEKLAMVACFERSLLILASPKSFNDELTESLLLPMTKHAIVLQSNINHSMGVYLYEAGVFDRSERSLSDAINLRRQLLDELRNQAPDQLEQSNGVFQGQTFSSSIASYFFSSPQTVSAVVLSNVMEYSVNQCCTLLPQKVVEKSESDDLELSLSLTLEYAALTNHACQSYQKSLASFQEALILRSLHVGKNSLDIASLHFNTGVVHDDLEQYHHAINRYHESARIRLNHLKKASAADLPDLEESVLLTLKCMAHVYKLIDDLDNAICYYLKASILLKSRISRHTEPADKWQIMGMRLDLSVPAPTILFDEMRKDSSSGNDAWKLHFQAINKKTLCHHFSESQQQKPEKSSVKKWERELVKMQSVIVALIQKKKHTDTETGSNSFSRRSPSKKNVSPASSVTLDSTLPKSQLGGLFDVALMSSSFCIGRSRMAAQRYDEAVDSFEASLRTKWSLDPASSSDSDSDASSRVSIQRSRVHSKNISEDEPEEGQLYYALGLANAMSDDHERAVRCFITALRYLRRSLRMVDSLEVARVLFDTATSYYYLCDFDQADANWNDCLRIIRSQETEEVSCSWRRGIVLYCLVLNQIACRTSYDSSMYTMLNEAQTLLSTSSDKTILAYMEFLTAKFLHKTASKIPTRLRTQIPTNMKVVSISSSFGGLSWDEMCKTTLSLLEQVKNECWFDPTLEETANTNDLKHLPISAHTFLLEGQVNELMGRSKYAMNSYQEALNFYRIACGQNNVYSASVLHRMGMLCAHSNENGHKALGFFNESIAMRKQILGGNHPRLAESLYCSASVLTLLYRYESAMERYHEALRIQMATVGQSSNDVATTLTGMALCHYNHKSYDLALTCFMGALKVRDHRVSHLQKTIEDAKKKAFTDTTTSLYSNESQGPSFDKLDEVYVEETSLGDIYFNLGNVHLHLGDHKQAMNFFIKARDLKWRHVGGGSTEKIMKRYTWSDIDEDELLGLAHCLHNIGLLYDMQKQHERSLPHYEEALVIKNALAGIDMKGSSVVATDESDQLVLKCLDDDTELPVITKATLSTAMTHVRMASVYAKRKMYDHSLHHYCHALKIQRKVLGRDHFTTSLLLSNMGNVLRRTKSKNQHSETAEALYKESLRISSLTLGRNHERVASTLFNLGELHDSKKQFDQAISCYRSALSVYREKYTTRLRQRLCCNFISTLPMSEVDAGSVEVLSTGDQIVMHNTSFPTKEIQKQYCLVSEALRKATREGVIRQGGTWFHGSSNEYWLRFEVLLFQFVEMVSSYVVDPTNAAVKSMITQSQQRIESAASHAIITAADALDYQFQLMLQE